MKRLALIIVMLVLPFFGPALAQDAAAPGQAASIQYAAPEQQSATAVETRPEEQQPAISDVIFEHIGDAYEWHLLNWGDKSLALHLPVILYKDGWHLFSSARLEGGESYEGFRIAPKGEKHEGKIVDAEGNRPFDISITKNVLSLIMGSLLLLVLVLLTARWYRTHDAGKDAPKGLAACMEPLVMMVHDMARENIGEKDFRRYSPYLCTAFLFILLNNLLGIVPIFPGGANLTGNIACTLVLALFTFFSVNLTGTKHYYEEIFNPDVPGFLKPIMAVIEVFSALVKPISLTIRLFANMLAGHIQLLCMVCIIFIMAKYGGVLLGGMSFISVLFGIFLDVLELLISFIQAYIFTMLSSIYIGLARQD